VVFAVLPIQRVNRPTVLFSCLPTNPVCLSGGRHSCGPSTHRHSKAHRSSSCCKLVSTLIFLALQVHLGFFFLFHICVRRSSMRGRPTQLVCQHLEGISRRALEQFSDVIREYVRGRHGVYALYKGNRLYYVGLASNLRRRLKQHLGDRHAHTWDRFSVYLTIGDEHLRELEALVLRIASPRGNEMLPRFVKSQDLRRLFRREIASRQRRERDSLFEVEPQEPRGHRRTPLPTTERAPKLAGYFKRKATLRLAYKGHRHKARVGLDGNICFQGKKYTSPSAAASAITKRAADGWKVWKYERAPGDWVPLDTLRRK